MLCLAYQRAGVVCSSSSRRCRHTTCPRQNSTRPRPVNAEGHRHQSRVAESSRPHLHQRGRARIPPKTGRSNWKAPWTFEEAAGPATHSRLAMPSPCRGWPPGMEAPRPGAIPLSSPARAGGCSRSLPPSRRASRPVNRRRAGRTGKPRFGPPPGQIMGYWGFPSATTLVEQSAEPKFRPTRTACCATSRISTRWRRFSAGPETSTNCASGIS